ncbi:nucleotidyltransferase family protein [Zhihengliuella salsuginis]|uniref:Nucleotidyltransferase-like protein n=1 Tax=Zhihengliuella salsuginis TaxID=578222 RepID=A0ABQ3GFF2_9MICC|nr:nucleotidyltransferase family protein [Zhihengliuella salsuginis]GHD04417.1 hypothetical protein GCM10008096_11720 [Zhihengliuella salsuginis]
MGKLNLHIGHEWGDSVDLRLREAIQLSAALVFDLAERRGLRAVILKGPPATELGVRSERPSSDIDLLVDRDDIAPLIDGLEDLGWLERPTTHDGEHPLHSVTLYHPNWPADIDIHHSYPGCEVGQLAAFDALWARRRPTVMGERTVLGLDVTATVLVQALHALREAHKTSNIAELDYLLTHAPVPAWADFESLARQTGSLGPLRSFIKEAYPEVDHHLLPAPGDSWRQRSEVSEPGVFRLLHLQSLPWKDRPKYALRGLFPQREQLAASDITLLNAPAGRVWAARLSRLLHFLKRLPRAVRQWRNAR